jgi:hypothetical protein
MMTKTTFKVKANGSWYVSRREVQRMGLDNLALDYLLTKSEATRKTPPKSSTN